MFHFQPPLWWCIRRSLPASLGFSRSFSRSSPPVFIPPFLHTHFIHYLGMFHFHPPLWWCVRGGLPASLSFYHSFSRFSPPHFIPPFLHTHFIHYVSFSSSPAMVHQAKSAGILRFFSQFLSFYSATFYSTISSYSFYSLCFIFILPCDGASGEVNPHP